MAARLTDRKRKKIIADYVELGSYNAAARRNSVSKDTVKRIVQKCDDFAKMAQEKKDRDAQDILAYMETKRDKVCQIIDLYLVTLLDLSNFKNLTPNQLTTAMGTLIDKFAPLGEGGDGESGVVVLPPVMDSPGPPEEQGDGQ